MDKRTKYLVLILLISLFVSLVVAYKKTIIDKNFEVVNIEHAAGK